LPPERNAGARSAVVRRRGRTPPASRPGRPRSPAEAPATGAGVGRPCFSPSRSCGPTWRASSQPCRADGTAPAAASKSRSRGRFGRTSSSLRTRRRRDRSSCATLISRLPGVLLADHLEQMCMCRDGARSCGDRCLSQPLPTTLAPGRATGAGETLDVGSAEERGPAVGGGDRKVALLEDLVNSAFPHSRTRRLRRGSGSRSALDNEDGDHGDDPPPAAGIPSERHRWVARRRPGERPATQVPGPAADRNASGSDALGRRAAERLALEIGNCASLTGRCARGATWQPSADVRSGDVILVPIEHEDDCPAISPPRSGRLGEPSGPRSGPSVPRRRPGH
jgi:hypothetical protein